LIGWSTAFLLSVTARLKSLEYEWLEEPRADDAPKRVQAQP
jgi:hypothetical protein